MNWMPVHSYGTCLHNANEVADAAVSRSASLRPSYNWQRKLQLLATFRFVLVFENTDRFDDYVTEKLTHALLANAVPVYWGARNIECVVRSPAAAHQATQRVAAESQRRHQSARL